MPTEPRAVESAELPRDVSAEYLVAALDDCVRSEADETIGWVAMDQAVPIIQERDRQRDAAVRRAALEEAASELSKFYWAERARLLNDYKRINTGYDEGYLDGFDIGEQRIRALLAQEKVTASGE